MSPQRLLVLNWEDYVKINPILQNPPSETKVVATNLRFTCWNYYDYLQDQTRMMKAQSKEEYYSMLSKIINGNIITLYDIANLYTKELGIKVVPWEDMPWKYMRLDVAVQKILALYYRLNNISFENWIKKSTVWAADLINPEAYGIGQIVSQDHPFKDFVLDFTTEGNTLTYVKSK